MLRIPTQGLFAPHNFTVDWGVLGNHGTFGSRTEAVIASGRLRHATASFLSRVVTTPLLCCAPVYPVRWTNGWKCLNRPKAVKSGRVTPDGRARVAKQPE